MHKETGMPVALLSVFDKAGIADFAKGLIDLNFAVIASGGTFKALRDAGLEVTNVADWVGGGAILGHRVVTLSREIHGALLADDSVEHRADLTSLGVRKIDLVCVDMYPLQAAVANEGATEE